MPRVKVPKENPFLKALQGRLKVSQPLPEEQQLVPNAPYKTFIERIREIGDVPLKALMGGDAAGDIMNLVMPLQVSNLYHGSPYKFSKFINEAVGTGEGAQSFGWGHYLTESPDIAKQYARPHRNATSNFMSPDEKRSLLEIIKQKYPKPKDYPNLKYSLSSPDTNMSYNDLKNFMGEGEFRDVMNEVGMSNIYETTVNKGKPSSADVFLEWDKPVEGKMQEFFTSNPQTKNYFDDTHVVINKGLKSEHRLSQGEAYKLMERAIGEKEASRILSNLGFTGIKYPSGTLSGIKDSPYYNYVIFNPDDITIDSVKRVKDK